MDTVPPHDLDGNPPEKRGMVCSQCAMIRDLLVTLAPDQCKPFDAQESCGHFSALESALSHARDLAHEVMAHRDLYKDLHSRIEAFFTWIEATRDVSDLACDLFGSGGLLRQYLAIWDEVKTALCVPNSYREPIPSDLRLRIIERDQYICSYCKKSGDATEGPDGRAWHIDHVIPYIAGGPTEESNLVLACATCNTRKHDKLDWVYTPIREIDA